jgi:mRNA interferase MazF
MNKKFDEWNEIKKAVHARPDNFGVHEREIWWLSLGVNIGVEMDGKHKSFERPVLVLRKFNRQMVWVLPTTSRGKDERFYEKFLFGGREYFVALTQPRTVSTKRFLRKIGMMSKSDFERIQQKIAGFVQKDENPR